MQQYIFNQDTPIIIYGAATEGHLLYNRIKESCKYILGFIDKRADEIDDIYGLPVWSLTSKEIKEHLDAVYIIAVKNVFDHRAIAYNLNKVGISKIVLIPVEISEVSNREALETAYNDLFYRQLNFPYVLEEVTLEHLHAFERQDYRIEKDGRVIVPVPISKVYTNKTGNTIWSDINIAAYFPHIRLFQYFAGNSIGSTDAYMQFCIEAAQQNDVKITEKWKKNVLENRKRIYDEMRFNYELKHEFFIDHASKAKWNGEYFNLTDGKHRAIFFTSIGAFFIPLNISLEDEERWINQDEAKRIYDGYDDNRTVDNPFFYKGEHRRFDTELFVTLTTTLAEKLQKTTGTINFQDVQIQCEGYNPDYEYALSNLRACAEHGKLGGKVNKLISLYVGNSVEQKYDICLTTEILSDKYKLIKKFINSEQQVYYLQEALP